MHVYKCMMQRCWPGAKSSYRSLQRNMTKSTWYVAPATREERF